MATKVSKKAAEPKKKTTAKKAAAKTAAPKKTAVKKVAAKKQVNKSDNPGSYVVLDYPVHNETIFGNHYAIRIGASHDGFVEISFNEGEWQPCRYAAGYWWFDWQYFMPGNYTVGVRLVNQDGALLDQTDHRPCVVC